MFKSKTCKKTVSFNDKYVLSLMYFKFFQDNNPCSSNPCLNGGTCNRNILLKNYTCTCSIYYAGEKCKIGKQLINLT